MLLIHFVSHNSKRFLLTAAYQQAPGKQEQGCCQGEEVFFHRQVVFCFRGQDVLFAAANKSSEKKQGLSAHLYLQDISCRYGCADPSLTYYNTLFFIYRDQAWEI
jgi:hypothetical protein